LVLDGGSAVPESLLDGSLDYDRIPNLIAFWFFGVLRIGLIPLHELTASLLDLAIVQSAVGKCDEGHPHQGHWYRAIGFSWCIQLRPPEQRPTQNQQGQGAVESKPLRRVDQGQDNQEQD
jgi:hypothetical protein